ncbi:unnamed protein product [Gordionus sp. m RMFG-2023]|uniref:uncharacterized protein LOC135925336 isoform X2 n=1 Tax=Gordionus sp. m RMFG-2023 TaxID=3053472 RepID=UPI0030E25026
MVKSHSSDSSFNSNPTNPFSNSLIQSANLLSHNFHNSSPNSTCYSSVFTEVEKDLDSIPPLVITISVVGLTNWAVEETLNSLKNDLSDNFTYDEATNTNNSSFNSKNIIYVPSGSGKSCLCNRFMKPAYDDYKPQDHNVVISSHDFAGRIINNNHFLFWGQHLIPLVPSEKAQESPKQNFIHENVSIDNSTDLSSSYYNTHCNKPSVELKKGNKKNQNKDDQPTAVLLRVIEQTEFIDDNIWKPFSGGSKINDQPYEKRCCAIELSSHEKLMYICKDQLGIEHEYEQVPFPNEPVQIDAFLICCDSSTINPSFSPYACLGERQLSLVKGVIAAARKSHKPYLIAITKADLCIKDESKNDTGSIDKLEKYIQETLSRTLGSTAQRIPVIATSAHANINVVAPFLALVKLVLKARGFIMPDLFYSQFEIGYSGVRWNNKKDNNSSFDSSAYKAYLKRFVVPTYTEGLSENRQTRARAANDFLSFLDRFESPQRLPSASSLFDNFDQTRSFHDHSPVSSSERKRFQKLSGSWSLRNKNRYQHLNPVVKTALLTLGRRECEKMLKERVASLMAAKLKSRTLELLALFETGVLKTLFPSLTSLKHERDWKNFKSTQIRCNPEFVKHFFAPSPQTPWFDISNNFNAENSCDSRQNNDFLLPWQLLETQEAQICFDNHLRQLISEDNRTKYKKQFINLLQSLSYPFSTDSSSPSNIVTIDLDRMTIFPGQPITEIDQLLRKYECYDHLSASDRNECYENHMAYYLASAKFLFLEECLFEHWDLFLLHLGPKNHFKPGDVKDKNSSSHDNAIRYKLFPNLDPLIGVYPENYVFESNHAKGQKGIQHKGKGVISHESLKEISQRLNKDIKYRILDRVEQERTVLILQFLAFLRHPVREYCPFNSLDTTTNSLKGSKENRCIDSYPFDRVLDASIFGNLIRHCELVKANTIVTNRESLIPQLKQVKSMTLLIIGIEEYVHILGDHIKSLCPKDLFAMDAHQNISLTLQYLFINDKEEIPYMETMKSFFVSFQDMALSSDHVVGCISLCDLTTMARDEKLINRPDNSFRIKQMSGQNCFRGTQNPEIHDESSRVIKALLKFVMPLMIVALNWCHFNSNLFQKNIKFNDNSDTRYPGYENVSILDKRNFETVGLLDEECLLNLASNYRCMYTPLDLDSQNASSNINNIITNLISIARLKRCLVSDIVNQTNNKNTEKEHENILHVQPLYQELNFQHYTDMKQRHINVLMCCQCGDNFDIQYLLFKLLSNYSSLFSSQLPLNLEEKIPNSDSYVYSSFPFLHFEETDVGNISQIFVITLHIKSYHLAWHIHSNVHNDPCIAYDGYVLVYDVKRKASFSVMSSFLNRSFLNTSTLPTLILAVKGSKEVSSNDKYHSEMNDESRATETANFLENGKTLAIQIDCEFNEITLGKGRDFISDSSKISIDLSPFFRRIYREKCERVSLKIEHGSKEDAFIQNNGSSLVKCNNKDLFLDEDCGVKRNNLDKDPAESHYNKNVKNRKNGTNFYRNLNPEQNSQEDSWSGIKPSHVKNRVKISKKYHDFKDLHTCEQANSKTGSAITNNLIAERMKELSLVQCADVYGKRNHENIYPGGELPKNSANNSATQEQRVIEVKKDSRVSQQAKSFENNLILTFKHPNSLRSEFPQPSIPSYSNNESALLPNQDFCYDNEFMSCSTIKGGVSPKRVGFSKENNLPKNSHKPRAELKLKKQAKSNIPTSLKIGKPFNNNNQTRLTPEDIVVCSPCLPDLINISQPKFPKSNERIFNDLHMASSILENKLFASRIEILEKSKLNFCNRFEEKLDRSKPTLNNKSKNSPTNIPSPENQERPKFKFHNNNKQPFKISKAISHKKCQEACDNDTTSCKSKDLRIPLIPNFLIECLDFVEREGYNCEGIYRVPGSKNQVEQLLKKHNQNSDLQLSNLDMPVNAVGTAVKSFLAELSDPLLPACLTNEMLEIGNMNDANDKINAWKRILNSGEVEKMNLPLIKYFIKHLNKISQFSDLNCMSCRNLAICFWPTLIRPEFTDYESMALSAKPFEEALYVFSYLSITQNSMNTFRPII